MLGMGIQACVNPQLFPPPVIEFFIIQEGTELFLVTYPPIQILIPGGVCGRGGLLYWGLGMRHPDNCEPPNVTYTLFCNSVSRKGQSHS